MKLPKNLESIGNNAFKECYALEGFYDDSSKEVNEYLNDKLTEIGNNAFMSCKSLSKITITYSLETIGDYAFAQTSQDVSCTVTSLSTLKNVSYYQQYTGLKDVSFRFAKNLQSIGKYAFQRSDLSNIDFLSDNIEELPESVCEDCYNLETVSVPETV